MCVHTALALPKKYLVSVSKEPQIVALKFGGHQRTPQIHSEFFCNEFLSSKGNQLFHWWYNATMWKNVCHYLNSVWHEIAFPLLFQHKFQETKCLVSTYTKPMFLEYLKCAIFFQNYFLSKKYQVSKLKETTLGKKIVQSWFIMDLLWEAWIYPTVSLEKGNGKKCVLNGSNEGSIVKID